MALEKSGLGAPDFVNCGPMRTALFIALFAFASSSFALSVNDLRSLITGPRDTNEYSGLNQDGLACSASLSLRSGQIEGFLTYGDTGAGVKADLTAPVKVLSKVNGVTTVQVAHFNEPKMRMTLTIENRKVTSMKIDIPNNFLWFTAHDSCNQLEQFTPRY